MTLAMDSNLALVSKPISSHTPRFQVASQTVSYTGEPHLHRYEESLPHHSSAFSSPQIPPPPEESHDSGNAAADDLDHISSPVKMQEGTPPQQDASAASLAEKKRNKLGYHRTSVACVHCRRRKIRCLVDQNDTQGRCQNCIRLKKECNFYPVDQQPQSERQRRPVAKVASQSSTSPAPSSQAPGESFAYPPPMGYPAQLPSVHGGGPVPIAPLDTGNFNAPIRGGTWDPYIESPISAPGHMSESGTPGFWPPYSSGPESARSAQFPGAYSPVGRQDSWQHIHQSHQSVPINTVGGHHGQQQRSMSLQHDGQGVYGGVPLGNNTFFDGRGPPSLQTSTGSPATTVSLSDATTAPGQTQPAVQYGLPTQWDPSKDYGGGPGAMAAGWYPDPGTVPSMPDDGSQGWQQHQPHGQGGFKPE